jgi:RNA polymerase sigma-70 factor (ECF subfamily)
MPLRLPFSIPPPLPVLGGGGPLSFVLAVVAGVWEGDAALAARLVEGDEDALRRLYDRLAGRVRAIALRLLARPSEADDVVQETFVEVWRSADRYDPARGSLATWVSIIAHRRAVDRLRRPATRPLGEEISGSLATASSSPHENVADGQERARVTRALTALPPEQREPIELMYYRGLSQSEAAELLGVALGTLKGRVRAGMARLGQMLGDPAPEARP